MYCFYFSGVYARAPSAWSCVLASLAKNDARFGFGGGDWIVVG